MNKMRNGKSDCKEKKGKARRVEDDLMKWLRKKQAKRHERRSKEALKVHTECQNSPRICESSRTMARNSNSKIQEYSDYHKKIKIAFKLRKWAPGDDSDNNNWTINLQNLKISNSRYLNSAISSPRMSPELETPNGITYRSILKSFSSCDGFLNLETDRQSTKISASNARLSYPSGYNAQKFATKARPLISYKTHKH